MRTNSLANLFFFFILSLLLSTLFSQVKYQSLFQTSLYLLIPLSFIAGLMLVNSTLLNKILQLTVITIFLISLYFFYQEFKLNLSLILSGRRFLGPFGWHNQQGALMLAAIPLSINFYLNQKKQFWLIISTILIFFLTITYSRASWLSLSFAGFTYILLNYKAQNQIILKKIIIFALIAFILSLTLSPVRSRLTSMLNFTNPAAYTTSERLRIENFFVSVQMIKDYPLFGLGPGVYGAAYSAYQTTPWLYSRFPHNQLLQFITELGLVGGLLILVIFYHLAINLYHHQTKIFTNTTYSALYISSFALIIHSFFDIDQNYSFFIVFLWISLGVLYQKIFPHAVNSFHSLITPLTIVIVFINLYSHITPNPFYQNLQIGNYDQAIINNPYSAEPHFFKALAYEQAKNLELAQKEYLTAIQKNPYSHPKYHLNLSALELNLGNPKAAELILQKAIIGSFPKNADYQALSHLNNLGDFEIDLNNLYTAYENVKKVNQH